MHLTVTALTKKIDQLLLAISKEDAQLINHYNHNNKKAKITFAKACTWADAIKKKKKLKQYNTWHYLNVPRIALTATKNNCSDGCLTEAILIHHNEFNTTTNLQNKVQALMFLGHWLGDIHQPLHVSFSSDYGGNKNKITPLVGRCENLHWYWDECLLYPIPKSDKKADKFDYLAFKAEILKTLKHKLPEAPKAQWKNSETIDWANESLTLIREKSFNYCQLKENNCLSKQNDKIVITKAYHQHYQNMLHERMLQAAVRLSSLLTEAL